jgi:hypothetical protein
MRRPRGGLVREAAAIRRALVVLVALAGLAAPLVARQPPPEPSPELTDAPLGAPAAWTAAERRTLLLAADSELRAGPSPLSRSVLRLDADTEVEVLEESAGWVRVSVGGLRGWVPADPWARPAASPGAGLGAELRALREARLERARSLLVDPRVAHVGAVEWWTDLHPQSRLSERVSALISCFADSYVERYGLDLVSYQDPDAVVVFVRQEAYRSFTEQEPELADLASGGFSGIGFAALYAGGRHADDVAAIVAHELTHLENRRRLALDAPPWLEEGLAEDMALAAAAGGGCPQPGGWPEVSRRAWQVGAGEERELRVLETMSGKLRSLACTLEEWRRSPPALRALAALDQGGFSQPQGRSSRYHTSALLVRFLLDGSRSTGEAARREAFRSYLRAGRDVGSFDFDDLLERLDADEHALAEALAAWARGRLGHLLAGGACP